jgi:putative serine protease PepD
MTDARPEPDETEASPEPGPRPEPVWARPTSPDPEPTGGTAEPVGWGVPAAETAATQTAPAPPPPSAPQPPTAPQPDPAPSQYPQYQAPPQYSPQHPPSTQTSQYPQYPQYVAPQGFGSPYGPGAGASGTGETQPGLTGQLLGGPQPPPPPVAGSAGGWPAQPLDPPQRGRSHGRVALFILVIAASLLAGAVGGVAGSALRDGVVDASGRNPTISLPKSEPEDPSRPASAVTTVAGAVLPSVVSIKVRTSTQAGTGSGFVIDAAQGYILTNNHVVTAGGTAPATSIAVVFQDGQQVTGTVVGLDASYDLAVVRVKAKGLRQLELGDSDKVRVGDPVVAIGAPLGLQGTVTTGIVSALNRPVAAGEGDKPAFINAIQTDAAINPGNSGGPLVDSAGKVIAVNSAIARAPDSVGATSGNIGLGFAIPSNQARRTAEELIRTGKAEHPIIGVSLDSTYEGPGVKVSERPSAAGAPPVSVGGPADHAGIKAGDVITKIGDRPVTEPDELIVAIRAQRPGDTVTLTVKSGNSRQRQVHVKLSASSD